MVKPELTNAELLIMKCAWDAPGEMVLSEYVAMANQKFNKGWKPQTVSTYLAHLVRKKFLKMKRAGKIYTYEILISADTYRKQMYEDFNIFWGKTSIADFLAAFFSKNEVSKEEIARMKELIK